ncbi:hypothetical protein HK104_000647 [Borealophlyctis nickersoniae]|nr:hypothetical protein HK104_000647 [Borealophlyctis nickersoniae]
MPPSLQTSPQEILQQVLNTLRSRFDYVHTALTCRAAFSAASDKALFRPWFIRYMRNQYFTLYDGHPKLETISPMAVMDAAGAEVLGYSFRDAIRLHDICDGYFQNNWVALNLQKGFLRSAVSILESLVIERDLKGYKELPVSDRLFIQRFLCTANNPCPFTAVTTLFSGEWYSATLFSDEWYKADDPTFYTFDAIVRQPMGDFDVGDRLCLVVRRGLKWYMALDTLGRVFHGAVRWKVHLPGGLSLIDADGFETMFKDDGGWDLPSNRDRKLDLGPEFRRGDPVAIDFQINKDLSGDLTIKRRPELKVTLGLKVTFHSIVWTLVKEERAEDESAENELAEDESAEDESPEDETVDQDSTGDSLG